MRIQKGKYEEVSYEFIKKIEGDFNTISVIERVYNEKGWSYVEYKLEENFTRDQFYSEFGRGATFPQLVVDGKKLGGCNESINLFRTQGFL